MYIVMMYSTLRMQASKQLYEMGGRNRILTALRDTERTKEMVESQRSVWQRIAGMQEGSGFQPVLLL